MALNNILIKNSKPIAKIYRVYDERGLYLEVAPMLFVRPGELRAAKWEDIDLDKAEWRFTVTKRQPRILCHLQLRQWQYSKNYSH